MSEGLWRSTLGLIGGKVRIVQQAQIGEFFEVPLLVGTVAFGIAAWLAGAWWISRKRRISVPTALSAWGWWGWLWWLIPAAWLVLDLTTGRLEMTGLQLLLHATPPMWMAVAIAGWGATWAYWARNFHSNTTVDSSREAYRIPFTVWVGVALYFVCFGTMNRQLYESLQIPHGDSAMYEEHIWNLLHGKGFRSYLDNGRLFLGEHVQVIHLAFIPLYILWPSHVLLELGQSLALASGAIPVFWIARRHGRSDRAGILLALAYLLYVPMQFLDIAIDLKTFRPNSFEIPLFLFALDAMERGKLQQMLVFLLVALSCQEDAAMIIASLGVWIGLWSMSKREHAGGARWTMAGKAGWGMAVFGGIYLILVIKVVLPYFRGGADVHFAKYFPELGDTSGEILRNLITRPDLWLGKVINAETAMFALSLLVPLGFLPLLSPGRLAVAGPLFGVLCLSEITHSSRHHFHAPLVPILLWSAAAGLGQVDVVWDRVHRWLRRSKIESEEERLKRKRIPADRFAANEKSLPVDPGVVQQVAYRQSQPPVNDRRVVTAGVWGLLCVVVSGLFVTFSPLGISFWDPDSRAYWRTLYIPGERAKQFPSAFVLVPADSRVASTDYIHPRFTHHARSYDYSHYRPDVPEDADFLVIDTRHPFSGIKRPEEVKELRDHPEQWEVLPDRTEGYFIVLRRRRSVEPERDP